MSGIKQKSADDLADNDQQTGDVDWLDQVLRRNLMSVYSISRNHQNRGSNHKKYLAHDEQRQIQI